MHFARLFEALRARPAVLVAVGLVLVCLFGFASALSPRRPSSSKVLFANSAPPTVATLEKTPVPVATFAPKPPPAPVSRGANSPVPITLGKANRPLATLCIHAELPPPQAKGIEITNRPLTTLALHASLPPDTNPPPLGIYAPSGRLPRCQLVNTVDSADTDTPIIALVTHDLWHDGKLVVPAGTEVHSRTRVARLRDRIVASSLWTLVWQSGEELTVRGIALDRDEDSNGQTWAITDGSAGLHGDVQNNQSTKKVELFLATFLSGMASGLKQTQQTIFGPQIASTVPNAALNGTSQVLNSYAEQILDTIKREGVFVRVLAGKQMYLYVTETLALPGPHRKPPRPQASGSGHLFQFQPNQQAGRHSMRLLFYCFQSAHLSLLLLFCIRPYNRANSHRSPCSDTHYLSLPIPKTT